MSTTSVRKLATSFGDSIASLRSIFSTNKIQPANFSDSDGIYEIKDFDKYVPPTKTFPMETYISDSIEEKEVNRQCGKKFCAIMRRAWATKYTEELTSDKITFLKIALRELFTYLIYLIILILVAYGTKSDNLYYLTTAMSNIIATNNFQTIGAMDAFWNYVTGDFLNALYWNKWYNNMPNLPLNEREFIYFENKMVGVPQLRQLRIQSNTCKIPSNFQNYISNCYGTISSQNANQSGFGLMISPGWVYTAPDPSNSFSFSGIFSNYNDGGFIQNLTRNYNDTLAILNNLQSNLWTDHYTRVVFLDFTIFNTNVNLYCIVKLIFEFPPTGGVVPTSQIRTVKLLRYETPLDFFILFCEIIVVFFIIYYAIEEVLEIGRNRWSYFKKIWNVLDVFMVVMSFACFAINIYRVLKTNTIVNQLVNNQNIYVDFDFISNWNRIFNEAMSVTVFFGVVKIFKYISFSKTMNILTDTLANSLKEMLGFAVMFFIVFFGFAQWGYLQFGSQVVDFSKFQDAIFTLFRLVLGDFSLTSLLAVNTIIGPIYYISYVFFVFFVLINMFVAIINDSYEAVKEELEESKDDLQIAKFLQTHFFNKLKSNKITKIQEVLEDSKFADCEQLSFQTWRDELQRRGYAEVEIQALFLQYDMDGDRTLDYEERRKLLNDLKSGKISLGEGKDSDKLGSQQSLSDDDEPVDEELFNVLVERVDVVEQSVFEIITKIDNILEKLGNMEKAKLDHQKSVSCSLSILTGSQISISA